MYFHTPFGPGLLVDLIMNEFLFYVSRASDFGLMKIDDTGRVISFSEKPKGDELKAMVSLTFFFFPVNCPVVI
jgi:dTDP-glucose pyrophosphorylase